MSEATDKQVVMAQRDSRLAQECAKLDPAEEKALAEEGCTSDLLEETEH